MGKKKPATIDADAIRDRIVEFRRVPASELRGNPLNWRTHSEQQRQAYRQLVRQIGRVGAELCYRSERAEGALTLIDGHMRLEESQPADEMPCLILDVTDAEADLLLATFDPLAAMATVDSDKLDALLREVQTGDDVVAKMLADLAAENGIIPEDDKPTELKQLSLQPPPAMTWVLIGIPTVRFGEINQTVEQMATIPEIILESTSNNG